MEKIDQCVRAYLDGECTSLEFRNNLLKTIMEIEDDEDITHIACAFQRYFVSES